MTWGKINRNPLTKKQLKGETNAETPLFDICTLYSICAIFLKSSMELHLKHRCGNRSNHIFCSLRRCCLSFFLNSINKILLPSALINRSSGMPEYPLFSILAKIHLWRRAIFRHSRSIFSSSLFISFLLIFFKVFKPALIET